MKFSYLYFKNQYDFISITRVLRVAIRNITYLAIFFGPFILIEKADYTNLFCSHVLLHSASLEIQNPSKPRLLDKVFQTFSFVPKKNFHSGNNGSFDVKLWGKQSKSKTYLNEDVGYTLLHWGNELSLIVVHRQRHFLITKVFIVTSISCRLDSQCPL